MKKTHVILYSIILLFAITFSILALNRHATFQTNGFDLGNVNQATWNTAHGRLFAFTNMAPIENRLALHVEPILLLFVPFYWLGWGGPKFLLVVQAVVVALGAWPLYLISRSKVGDWGAITLSAAYLLYPALEAAVMYDFHAVTLAPTFLLWAFYYLEQATNVAKAHNNVFYNYKVLDRRVAWRWAILFILLTLACKEDMGLVVAMLGLYVGLSTKQWKAALLIGVLGSVWSLTAILFIQPQFAPGGNIQGDRYHWLLESLTHPQLIWHHLWNDANLPNYLGRMFGPVLGLAFFAPFVLLPILPSLAINLLSSHPFTWQLESFHYAAPMAPFVFIATAKGMARIGKWANGPLGQWRNEMLGKKKNLRYEVNLYLMGSLGVGVLLFSITYHYYRGFSPLARPFVWQTVTAHHTLGAKMATEIEPELPLFAPLNLNPHVSNRRVLHQTYDTLLTENGVLNVDEASDWLWLDVASLPNQNNIQQFIRDTLLPHYQIVKATDGFLLLKPLSTTLKENNHSLPSDFYTFAQATSKTQPQYPLNVYFNDSLRLLGYDLQFNRAEEVSVKTYWQALKPLPPTLNPILFLRENGALSGATAAEQYSASLIWLAANKWPVGEVIVVNFNYVTWYTANKPTYRLGLGVSTVADPWDVNARWIPKIVDGPYANQLFADRRVVELARFKQVAGFPEGNVPLREKQFPSAEHYLDVVFDGQIRLVGYNLPKVRDTKTGLTLEVDLFWQGVAEKHGDYVRFVHLVGADGLLKTQHDSPPVNGNYPTFLWQQGEFVKETVILQLPFSALETDKPYTFHIGLYNPSSSTRLLNNYGQDHVEILSFLKLNNKH